MFEKIKHELEFIDTSMTPPIHYNLKRPTSIPETRDAFWNDYKKHGFGYVSAKYGGYNIVYRLKQKIKNSKNVD